VNGWVFQIAKVYRALVAFYPSRFRVEFGDEIQEVFVTALTESHFQEGRQLWQFLWREIRDWPASVLQEHLRERKREMPSNGFGEEKPMSRREALAAMVIFALPLIFIIATNTTGLLPKWVVDFMFILFWGALLFALGFAILKGLPRWSLPYLGFILLLGIVLMRYDRVWSWIYPIFLQLFGPRTHWSIPIRIFYVGIFGFILLTSVLLCALILVNLLRLLPKTRGVWQRIRADWTQLSFMVYGGFVFGILLTFDEYHYESTWKLIAFIGLGLGAWLYIKAKGQKQRILALIGGTTGAMWTVALAKWVLIPLQKWPTGYPVSPSEASRWVETGGAIIGWALILILLIAPALLDLLPSGTFSNGQKEINLYR
jgi:hypothetical protein